MGIIADSGTIFETGVTTYPAIAWLDSTHIVIAYVDAGDSSKGKVVCGSTSGVTPTFGTIAEFNAGTVKDVHIARLDDTHFVIAYEVSGDGKCVAGSVSGTTITLGSVKTFEASDVGYISICGMDATHFVIAYALDSPYTGVVIGASVSGVTITMGSKDTFASTTYSAVYNSICSLSSTHFVIAYRQSLSTADGIAVCGTLSGNTVTITEDGGSIFDDTSEMRYPSISALDSTHFVVAYNEQYPSSIGKVIAGSVSGTKVTIVEDGATTIETGGVLTTPSITAISASSFSIAFIDGSLKGNVLTGNVSGTTISLTVDSAIVFENGSCQGGVALNSIIDGAYYAIAFVDTGDSAKGKAILGSAPAIRQGVVDIESVPSISATGSSTRSGAAVILSVSSLAIVGNFNTVGRCSISAVSSLAALGGIRTHGEVSILVVSNVFAEWRVVGICSIGAVSSLSATGNRTAQGSVPIAIVSSVDANGSSILVGSIDIDVVSSVVANGDRHRMGVVTITAVSSAEIAAIAYVAQIMGYTGTLTAGDVLVIDTDEQTVELNGANATRYFTGEFPQLYVGTNELRWKDGGETPDLNFETAHKPRYL